MKSAQLAVLIVCVLLASCATMKNSSTDNLSGVCKENYDGAVRGEKEALAGIILMSVGGGMVIGGATPIAYENARQTGQKDDYNLPIPAWLSAVTLIVIGSAAVITGVGVFADGHVRVNGWNRHCVGATPAERYCLINEPIPLAPLPMEIRP